MDCFYVKHKFELSYGKIEMVVGIPVSVDVIVDDWK